MFPIQDWLQFIGGLELWIEYRVALGRSCENVVVNVNNDCNLK